MTDEPPSDYEQLPPDRAAHIDAVCDCFEQEWKASRTKGVRPSMTHYRELCAGPEREVLLRELAAIDRVYRRRYGSSDGQGSDSAPNGLTLAEARVGDSSSPDGSPASVVLAAASSPQAVPSTIGRFTLQRELGRGGMGVVYLAWDPELRREVAIKVLRGHGLSDPQARARFQTEARAAALLHHPNVVPVHEIGQDGSTSFIVLAYCPGVNLADWLQHQSEPVPHSDAAQLVATLADAVEFAHRHGVVHRDLKPANVLLELRGVDCELRNESRPQSANCNLQSAIPKITDFGLAKHIDEVAAQTQTGTAIGTPCYMAPEQTGTRSSATGPLTDVYALGGLLYELLTRRVPFQGETALDTLDQVRNREPIPPRQLRPRLPRDLETICLKCLEKEPRRRYASAHALAEELGRFLKGHPIHARPVSSWGRAVKWARCRPAVATLVASLGLVTLAGFVAVFGKYREVQFESGEKQKALELANQERQNALTAAAQAKADQLRAEAAHYGLQATLVQREWTHDNMQGARDYLAATDPALRSWEYGYLRRLCDPATLTLEGLDRPRRVAGSANGKWVAAFGTSRSDSPSGAIVVWDAVSGKQVQTFDNLPNPSYPLNFSSKGELILHGNRKDIVDAPNALAFSPDSKWLGAACTPETVVHIWDTVTWQERFAFKGHRTAICCMAFSPDSRLLATGSSDGVVKLWDLGDGHEVKELVGHKDPIGCLTFDAEGHRLVSGVNGFPAVGKVWTVPGGDVICTLNGLTEPLAASFAKDGTLQTICRDRYLETWDCKSGEQRLSVQLTSPATTTGFLRAAFDPDGDRLFGVSQGAIVEVWGRSFAKQYLGLKGHTKTIADVATAGGGRHVVSAGLDDTVRIWPLANPVSETIRVHDMAFALQLMFVPGDNLLFSACGDGRGLLWDLGLKRGVGWLKENGTGITAAAVRPNGKMLVTATADFRRNRAGDLRSWNAAGKQLQIVAEPHTQWVTAAAYRSDGRQLALASHDGKVYLCDPEQGNVERVLVGHEGPVWSVAYCSQDHRLASAGSDGTIRVWDSGDGELIQTLRSHTGEVRHLAFSPDGARLASAGADHTVKLWDTVVGGSGEALLETMSGHLDVVTSVAFHPDGRRLASGSRDGVIRLWDVKTAQEVLCFREHASPVLSVAFSGDGRWLASGSEDGFIRLWDGGENPRIGQAHR